MEKRQNPMPGNETASILALSSTEKYAMARGERGAEVGCMFFWKGPGVGTHSWGDRRRSRV